MEKTIIFTEAVQAQEESGWHHTLDLSAVELTSEEPSSPIENALIGNGGWVAREPGQQTIRLIFNAPQKLRRIRVLFREETRARAQEFVLSWLPETAGAAREIVRQQYYFSPPGTTQEDEQYAVELDEVKVLQLTITPDRNDPAVIASLERLQLA